MKIEELGFSKRTKNALKRGGVTNVNRLKYFVREGKLRDINGLGEKSYNEITEYIIQDWAKQ